MSGYTRSQTFRPGTFLKPCGLCGIRFRADELVRGEDGFYRCLRWCREVPPLTRDKISAESQRRKEAPPPPHGEPYDRKSTYAEEAIVFNFLCEQPVRDPNWPGGFRLGVPPHDFVDCTNGGPGALAANPATASPAPYSIMAAGEACRYLYGIINENKRPLKWIATAKVKLRQLADWLITLQRGFGTAPTSTKTNDGLFGGIANQDPNLGGYYATENAGAGLAFLYASRALGDAKYLLSAKASATFLRNMQAAPVTTYLGTLPVFLFSIGSIVRSYYPSALLAVEFWNELLTTSGDGQYGSDGTPAGFVTAPQQLLSQCIADARSFWSVGAYDINAGAVVNGLSTTTPCDFYDGSARQWNRADGLLAAGTLITSQNFAIGLRSLFNYEGYSTQVAAVWNYLIGFASNSLFTTATGTLATDYVCASGTNSANPTAPPVGQGNSIAPSYNPKLALATNLLVRDPTTLLATAQNGYDYNWFLSVVPATKRCTYDWTTFGLLAPVQSARDQGSFRTAKTTAITGRQRMPITFEYGAAPITDSPMLRGASGLAMQLSHFDDIDAGGNPVRRLWSATAAAMIGNAFRYQPQAWTGTNPPSQNPGLQV